MTNSVRQHLNLETDSEMREPDSDSNNNIVAILHAYEEIDAFLNSEVIPRAIFFCWTFAQLMSFQISRQQSKIWISDKSAVGFSNMVPENSLCSDLSPVVLMKAIKNAVEMAGKSMSFNKFQFIKTFYFWREGMENAHIKDAAALCSFFAWLEKEVEAQRHVTEISAADKLAGFRAEQADFVGLSFDTISSVGSNAAIIHYKPTPETDRAITNQEIFLCDSGGQYKDGTTDVTRTVHMGTPTLFERQCFTRVLKGQINLATCLFPAKIRVIRVCG